MNYTNKQKREIVKQDYDAIADIYAKHYSKFDSCKDFVDEFAIGLAGKYVLDLGCGAGNLTAYLADKGLLIEGIDFSEKLLKIAKKATS